MCAFFFKENGGDWGAGGDSLGWIFDDGRRSREDKRRKREIEKDRDFYVDIFLVSGRNGFENTEKMVKNSAGKCGLPESRPWAGQSPCTVQNMKFVAPMLYAY